MPLSRTTLLFNVVVILSYYLEYPWLSNCTFGFPLFVLMNTLAGHIYRNIRLKVYMDQTITSSIINRNFIRAATSTSAIPRSSLSSNPTSNGRRSGSTIGIDAIRHSLHSIEESHGEDGMRDLEKQDDDKG